MYLYLEPIFSFEDIAKTLITEAEKFKHVNNVWKMIMGKIIEDPKVLNIKNIPNVLEEL